MHSYYRHEYYKQHLAQPCKHQTARPYGQPASAAPASAQPNNAQEVYKQLKQPVAIAHALAHGSTSSNAQNTTNLTTQSNGYEQPINNAYSQYDDMHDKPFTFRKHDKDSRRKFWKTPKGLKIIEIAEDSMFQSRMLEVLRTYPCRLQESPAELLPYLFLGNYMDARNTGRLRELGITHVVNCASLYADVANPYPEESGVIGFLSFTADDALDYDMIQHFEEAKTFIDEAVASGGKVLVHCAQGINRSGVIVVAYLMASQNWDLIETTQYVKTHRGLLLTNQSFQKQLIQFARENDLLHPSDESRSKFTIPLEPNLANGH